LERIVAAPRFSGYPFRVGSPDHVAVDVVLDDGRTVLFWHYELEDIS